MKFIGSSIVQKYGRRGFGVSGVMIMTVSAVVMVRDGAGDLNSPRMFAAHTATAEPTYSRLRTHTSQVVPTGLPHHCAKHNRVGSSISGATALRIVAIKYH